MILIVDLLDALVTHVDSHDPLNTCLIVCGDFNLDITGKRLKETVSSKGFEIYPQKQERKRFVDFALVRGSRVNVLSCEAKDPEYAVLHHRESKSISQKKEHLPSIKDEDTVNTKHEDDSRPGKTPEHAESEESGTRRDNADLRQDGLQAFIYCLLVDNSSDDPKFDHTFFHLVLEVNCVNNTE